MASPLALSEHNNFVKQEANLRSQVPHLYVYYWKPGSPPVCLLLEARFPTCMSIIGSLVPHMYVYY